MMELDKIILGDNQFFGINHMSWEKSQERLEKFSTDESILSVLEDAVDVGINAFMLNSNDRSKQICKKVIENDRLKDLIFYPSIPYPHKYANLVNEKGIISAVNSLLFSSKTTNSVISKALSGSKAYLKKDILSLMKLLIDLEMENFENANFQSIFLQNVITDLILGLNMDSVLVDFVEYIKSNYNAEPGFITMNAPKLIKLLTRSGIKTPLICTSLNSIGYLMSPDKKTYEKDLKKYDFKLMAMSIFASGAISPETSIKYLFDNYNIHSVVFGASSKKHIKHTKNLIEKYFSNNL